MDSKSVYKYMMGLLMVLTSACIRDEVPPCPPLSVKLEVKDKNYFNIKHADGLEPRLADNLPFSEYIPTLYYRLSDAKTGEVIESQGVFKVEGKENLFELPICGTCLPHGKYVVTVWGGLNEDTALLGDGTKLNLHPDHKMGDDVFLANDTLVYDYQHSDYVMQMERTKGKLLVQVEGLSQGHYIADLHIDKLFGSLTNNWDYNNDVSVEMHHEEDLSEDGKTKMGFFLAPSVAEKESVLSAEMSLKGESEKLPQKDVCITMFRNELTILRYIFDNGKLEIYLKINDNWEIIKSMELD